MDLAQKFADDLNETVFYFVNTDGGGSTHFKEPIPQKIAGKGRIRSRSNDYKGAEQASQDQDAFIRD